MEAPDINVSSITDTDSGSAAPGLAERSLRPSTKAVAT